MTDDRRLQGVFVTTTRKVLASVATIAAAASLMAFGTLGEFTAENAGITQSTVAE
jgi:hypothetical protein